MRNRHLPVSHRPGGIGGCDPGRGTRSGDLRGLRRDRLLAHRRAAGRPRPGSAKRRGYELDVQRARRLGPEDCERFDYILVMDEENYRTAAALCRRSGAEVRLLLDYAPDSPVREVPDPYFDGPEGFEKVLDLVESAVKGLLDDIRERHLGERV